MKYNFHDPELEAMAEIAKILGSQMSLTYLKDTTANAMLAQITTTGLYLALYTTSPGTSGSGEIAYNSSTGYTQSGRQSIGWGTSALGIVTSNTTQTFTMGASWTPASIGYFGLWSAATGGAYLAGGQTTGLSGSIPAGANVVFTNSVTLTVSG